VQYASAVRLFQTKFFAKEDFPEENKHFANVTYVDPVDNDLAMSLLAMRTSMFQSAEFDAAVFVGGMEGVIDEHTLFSQIHPKAKCIVIKETGGAARSLAATLNYTVPADIGPLDFMRLLYRELDISPIARRTG